MSSSSESTSDAGTGGLVFSVAIGSAVFGVCLIAFEILRRLVPNVYEYRRTCKDRKKTVGYFGKTVRVQSRPKQYPFGWIVSVLQLDLSSLEDTHGLDVAFFVRFLRTRVLLFLCLSLVSCCVLLPVYWSAPNKDLPEGDSLRTQGLQIYSLANVPHSDKWRFWMSLAVQLAMAVGVMGSLYVDFLAYDRARRRYRTSCNPSNYAVLVQDIPQSKATEEQITKHYNGLFPHDVDRVCRVFRAKKLLKWKARFWTAVEKRERAEWDYAFKESLKGARPTHKPGACSCCKGKEIEVDSIDYWTERQEHYRNKVEKTISNVDEKQVVGLPCAFVIFKTKRAASIAAQTILQKGGTSWRICRAPEPKAINWTALAIDGQQADVRAIITFVSIVVLTLLWGLPVAFVQLLANLSALAEVEIPPRNDKPFAFLRGVDDLPQQVINFVEGFLPPVLHSVLVALIPVFIRLLVNVSRVVSLARVDSLVRTWFFEFLFFNSFLFVLIAGSVLEQVDRLVALFRNPRIEDIADLLAKTIPSQGTFFMNVIIVKGLTGMGPVLIQLPRLVLRWLFNKLLDRTPRQLEKRDDTSGQVFLYFRFYAFAQLVTLLGIVYSTISPVVVPCALLFFLTNYLVLTYNLVYTVIDPYHSAGALYPGSLSATVFALGVQQITMLGLFTLKQQETQGTVSLVMVGVCIAFKIFLHRRFPRVAEHGSLLETQLADIEAPARGRIPPKLSASFKYPGLDHLPDPVEDLSGVPAEKKMANSPNRKEISNQPPTGKHTVKATDLPQTTGLSHFDSGDTVWEDARGEEAQAE